MSAVTHSKLRKVLDGTGTQVATCIINRWTVKMNGREGYITTEISQERGTEERRRKRRKTIAVLRTPESSRREASENQEEEEFILGLSLRINFYPFSTHSTISLPYSLIRLLKKPSLRPSS